MLNVLGYYLTRLIVTSSVSTRIQYISIRIINRCFWKYILSDELSKITPMDVSGN